MKILLFANTDWYLFNFRLPLAKSIKQLGVEVVLVSPPGKYGARLREEGFRWIPVQMNRRSLNPWSEAEFVLELFKVYRSERPTLVHHFTIKSVVYGSIAARLAGVRNRVNAVAGLGYVFTSTTVHARLLRPVLRLLMRFALRGNHCRLILQNRDDCALFIKNRLVAQDQIRLIRGSGVNTTRFFNAPSSQSSSGVVRVVLATRLLWEKGVGDYADAARTLKNSGSNIEFLLAGSPDNGNPASVNQEIISEWATEGILVALGHIDDMAELLSQVDIVVLPTSYGEGTPRILLEAAASGLPIVATDVPGCREIVIDGLNGLLIPARDSCALVEAIKYLADNPQERVRMGQAGRKKVLAEFDEQAVIGATVDVYRELLPLPLDIQQNRSTDIR